MATYPYRRGLTFAEAAYSGAIAGVIAGAAMAIVAMIAAVMMGQEVWTPAKMIAVTFIDESWIGQAGFQSTPVFTGMLVHFVTAIAFGILFALIGGRLTVRRAIGWGGLYGLGIWVLMQFVWLPIINSMLADTPLLPFAIEHLVFGGLLGVYPAFLPARAKAVEEPTRFTRAA